MFVVYLYFFERMNREERTKTAREAKNLYAAAKIHELTLCDSITSTKGATRERRWW